MRSRSVPIDQDGMVRLPKCLVEAALRFLATMRTSAALDLHTPRTKRQERHPFTAREWNPSCFASSNIFGNELGIAPMLIMTPASISVWSRIV